jgi:hypothetical protein
MSTIPFTIPAHPRPISIQQARVDLPPEQFRLRLRSHLLKNPGLTLAQVARELKASRQYVSQLVGKLNRPNCASPLFMRLAPKTEVARRRLPELTQLVSQGHSAEAAAAQLGISLGQAYKLGFRSRPLRPQPHGGERKDCFCWRCRRAQGIARPRGPRTGPATKAQVLDWLAYRDPYDGEALSQATVGRLCGISQGAVSRIARGAFQ